MRLCLMIEGQEGVSYEQWTALARACEEAGLEGLFRSDHYLSVAGMRDRVAHDAWATLAALAATTSTIRLGALVSPATFRHPSVLAKTVATVDHVSGGRVELGLGAGWNEGEHEAYGFPFPPLRERMDMLEEQLEIVRRSWAEDAVTFEGSHYTLVDCPALPKPLQVPHPPIIVGGTAGPRSVAMAARLADEYNTLGAGVDDCRERRRKLDEGCERAGRDPATLPMSLMVTTVVGADRSEVLERTRRVMALWGREDVDPAGVLEERSDRWLAGTPDEVRGRLADLADAGVARVYLQHLGHEDLDMVALIGAEVAGQD